MTKTITINERATADAEQGFDVMDGRKVVAHYDPLAEAQEHARRKARYCVRYWGKRAEQ